MSKTSVKTPESMQHFSPKDLTSPIKYSTGLTKTLFMHISDIHNLLNNWIKIIDKGGKIVKAMSALRMHECEDAYYPQQLTSLTQDLLEATNSLKDILNGTEILHIQLQALAKLQPTDSPIINTWSAHYIACQISKLYSSLEKEYKIKQTITEYIAHCRDEKLIEVYASAWEFSLYINMESTAYLFAEVGLSGIL